jgi:hypothetical protein
MSERNKNNAEHIITAAAESITRRTRRGGVWPVWKDSRRDPVKFEPLAKREAVKRYHEARALDRAAHAKGAHGGRLGRVALAVLHALTFDFLHFASGQCDPSHASIAKAAGCCARAVGAALKRLKRAGVVAWQRRCDWDSESGRLAQLTNAYSFAAPARWHGWTPRTIIPKPEPGTWGDHPPGAEEAIRAAVDAIAVGARGLVQRALDFGDDPLTAALARFNRTRDGGKS